MTDPRDRILERRAAFVAASLALAGCGAGSATPATPAANATPPAPSTSAAPSGVAPVESASAPPAASSAPPPKDVPPAMAAKYRGMHDHARALGAVLDRTEQALATCKSGTSSPACQAARDEAAKELYTFDGKLRSLRYLCKGQDEDERAFERASNAEAKRLGDRQQKLQAQWRALVGDADWDDAYRRAAMANPVPCLSIVCKEWW